MDITTTHPITKKTQKFEVRIENVNYVRIGEFLNGYSDDTERVPNLDKLVDAIAKVNKATLHNLEFLPLTEEGAETPQGDRKCSSYRGEGKYTRSGMPNDPDQNAFVIRKQTIDFIVRGRGVEYAHIGERRIGFEAWISNHSLTPGQSKTLVEWFEKQILDAVTPEVIQAVKDEQKAKLIDHVKREIPKIKGWIKLIEAFQG